MSPNPQDLMHQFRQGQVEIIDDYLGGESIELGYDSNEARFYVQRIDTVVGSYNETVYYDEGEFLPILSDYIQRFL